jgi:hypothetical protein
MGLTIDTILKELYLVLEDLPAVPENKPEDPCRDARRRLERIIGNLERVAADRRK